MWRPSTVFLVIASAVSGTAIAPFPAIAEENEHVQLDQIQTTLSKWRASFETIRVVYELRSLPPVSEPLIEWSPPTDLESAPKFAEVEWILTSDERQLVDERTFYWSPGQVGHRNVHVFNGSKGIAFHSQFQKSAEGLEELKTTEVRKVAGLKPTHRTNLVGLSGLHWASAAEWLPEKLARSKCELKEIESVLGARCARIVAQYSNDHGGTSTEVLWLDLEHDCLPRRYHLLDADQLFSKDFVVDELQQLNGGLWFPKQARLQLLGSDPAENQLVVLTEAEINQPLESARFYPPTPDEGTRVRDQRTRPEDHAKSQRRSAKAEPVSTAPTSTSRVGLTTIIFVSVSVLAIGLFLQRK